MNRVISGYPLWVWLLLILDVVALTAMAMALLIHLWIRAGL